MEPKQDNTEQKLKDSRPTSGTLSAKHMDKLTQHTSKRFEMVEPVPCSKAPKHLSAEDIAANRQAFQNAFNDPPPESLKQGESVARGAIPADPGIAAGIWLDYGNTATLPTDYTGQSECKDEDGNDWQFDLENGQVVGARVLYDIEPMEDMGGGELDIDVLDHLSAEESRTVERLWDNWDAEAKQTPGTVTIADVDGKQFLVTHDGKGNIESVRRDTGRPSSVIQEQATITQSELYRETLATGHQDAQAQVVRNELGIAIQVLRNLLVELRKDTAEVYAASEGKVTTGEVLTLYFKELLDYKALLDSGKDTTEAQDQRTFFILSIIAFFKTQYDFLKDPKAYKSSMKSQAHK